MISALLGSLLGVDEAEDQRDEHRGKGQGRYEPADDGTAEEDGEEHAGLHHHIVVGHRPVGDLRAGIDRKSTRLNSSHVAISYAVFCLKKKRYEKKHVPYADTGLAYGKSERSE